MTRRESIVVDILRSTKEQRDPEGERVSFQKPQRIFPIWKSFEIIVSFSKGSNSVYLIMFLEASTYQLKYASILVLHSFSNWPYRQTNFRIFEGVQVGQFNCKSSWGNHSPARQILAGRRAHNSYTQKQQKFQKEAALEVLPLESELLYYKRNYEQNKNREWNPENRSRQPKQYGKQNPKCPNKQTK